MEAQTKRNVLRLTQTYITLSLADIASNVGLPTAEAAELAILRCVSLSSRLCLHGVKLSALNAPHPTAISQGCWGPDHMSGLLTQLILVQGDGLNQEYVVLDC